MKSVWNLEIRADPAQKSCLAKTKLTDQGLIGDGFREADRGEELGAYIRINYCRCRAQREVINGSQQRPVVEQSKTRPDHSLTRLGEPLESAKQFAAERIPGDCDAWAEVLAVIENRLVVPAHAERQRQVWNNLPLVLYEQTDHVIGQPAFGIEPLDEAAWVVRKKVIDGIEGKLPTGS